MLTPMAVRSTLVALPASAFRIRIAVDGASGVAELDPGLRSRSRCCWFCYTRSFPVCDVARLDWISSPCCR